nr:unnamed protein product [Callosobruchus analis]
MYLDSRGTKVDAFNNNFPGQRWAECFLARHKREPSQRVCSNIKRVRAAVNEEAINSFFRHLEIEIKDVLPESIYNYDETNLVDDPGKNKIITKRGCKYPEAIKNSTKAAVSIMVSGNAAGELLPPYVNYKAEKMWDTWTEGGPPNAHYNRSKSGVLKACEENDTAFIALPPNSTQLTQPLDVAFFRPFKCHWRQILDTWKSTPDGQRLPTIPKNVFPSLLNKLWVKILGNAESNVMSGFMNAGIYPLCAEKVLERLPTYSRPEVDNPNPMLVSDAFIEYMKNVRKEAVGENVPKRRKRKLDVAPGRSISAEEVKRMLLPSNTKADKIKKKKQFVVNSSSSEEGESDNVSLASSSSLNLSDENSAAETTIVNLPNADGYLPEKDEFVVVVYEAEYWPGQVMSIEKEGAHIKRMEKYGRLWRWPEKEDCIF